MDKWDYIDLISKRGSPYGADGGILDLLQWCGKLNTMQVTEEEARAFLEGHGGPETEAPEAPD